jgi:phage tail-like protein
MVTATKNHVNGVKEIKEVSHYLDYLPAPYRDRENEFMGRFLLIFESIMDPLFNTVDNMPLYFDPRITPDSLLPWLATWVDQTLDPAWPLERRRELVAKAAELYRWRGTRRGLTEYLRIYTGKRPQIIEYIPGMILDQKTLLGENTVLGSSGSGHHFTVIVEAAENENIDPRTIRSIIDSQKPAHTQYTLMIGDKVIS